MKEQILSGPVDNLYERVYNYLFKYHGDSVALDFEDADKSGDLYDFCYDFLESIGI